MWSSRMQTRLPAAGNPPRTPPWGARTIRPLTTEDHRQINANLKGFFDTLAEWAKREAERPLLTEAPPAHPSTIDEAAL